MQDLRRVARHMARKYGIPPSLFLSLVKHESGWRPDAVSPAGATGLTQLMPATAKGLGVDPRNPLQNLEGGARYLRGQFDRFGRWDLALAAYNAGPGRVQDGSWRQIPETSRYVRNVMGGRSTLPTGSQPLSGLPVAGKSPSSRYDYDLTNLLNRTRELVGLPTRTVPISLPPPVSTPISRKTGGAPRASNSVMNRVLQIAHQQIGKPYVWGGESPREGGFDCSGLIDWAFRQAGIQIPAGRLTTYNAMQMGRSVKGQQIRPGDWVVTNGGKHMVLYVGRGRVIAAPHRGAVVQYQPLSRFRGQIVDVRRLG